MEIKKQQKISNGVKKFLFFSLVFFSLFFLLGLTLPGCQKNAGIWRSDDRGETWAWKVQIDKKHSLSKVNVLQLVFDPGDPRKLYLCSENKGLYFSGNRGDTWQPTKIAKGAVWDIAFDPEDSRIMYAAVFEGNLGRVYLTRDGGEAWEMVFADTLPASPIYNVVIDWYNHNVLISTGWGGILRSEDQGKTWQKIAELSARAGIIYSSHQDSRLMWYVTPTQGIFRTQDGGETWEEIALPSLKNYSGASRIYRMEIDPESNNFYLATDYGLLVSIDEGKSWQPLKTLTPVGSVPYYAVAVNPLDSREIMFVAGNSVFKSINEGESWSVRKVYTGAAIRYLKYHPTDSAVIYLGIREVKK